MFKMDRKDADTRGVAAQAVKPPPEPPKIEVARDPVERRLLYTLQDSIWHEANGKIRTAPQYSQVSVPEAIAVVAIKNNLAADFHSERVARLIECFGIRPIGRFERRRQCEINARRELKKGAPTKMWSAGTSRPN